MSKVLAKTKAKSSVVTLFKRHGSFYVEWKGGQLSGIAGPFNTIESASEIFTTTASRILKESTS